MKPGIFEYMSSFWKSAEQEAFTPTEAALYFFLLDRANSQKWCMPIRCPTETVRVYLATSKQNVIKAREGLYDRKLIDFIPGKGKGNYPLYTLTLIDASPLSDGLSVQLSDELSLYKNKDNISTNNARESELSLEVLERQFLANESLHEDVISLMSSKGVTNLCAADVRSQISQFFLYLKASGVEKREEGDCRKHCVNWLLLKMTKKQSNEHSTYNKNRSAIDETGASATASYYAAF